ncbi:hypothetical protein AB0C07_18015 [Actinoplanes missouriensis]|uniref:hypothetical protein n=1 Tax=Actinoplanes missouriensis TaxID=1866 RepID=UPI00340F8E43
MAESSDVVLAYWNEHRQQLRQSETQRATMTNFVLVITAALSGLIIQQRFTAATISLGILITVFGLFGAVIATKYHERAAYHLSQARALTTTLKEINVLPDTPTIVEFRHTHYDAYPIMHRIRLHWLWTGLNLAIALYGTTLTVIAIAS